MTQAECIKKNVPFAAITDEPFDRYRRRCVAPARAVYGNYDSNTLDEQAGPAYLEGFALSRWVFWRRLAAVHNYLRESRGDICVDFGCGFGLLLPFLKRHYSEVHGVDLMPDLARQFLAQWDKSYSDSHSDIEISTDIEATYLAPASVDLILALDVLEHVEDLPGVLKKMRLLLKPNGRLLVSGPTENRLYKLGRRIVGFSGEYHHRNINDIRRVMEEQFDVKTIKRLFFPFTLFELLAGTK